MLSGPVDCEPWCAFGAENTYNFPGATCISVNEEAAHGIPGRVASKRQMWSTSMCPRNSTVTLRIPVEPAWCRLRQMSTCDCARRRELALETRCTQHVPGAYQCRSARPSNAWRSRHRFQRHPQSRQSWRRAGAPRGAGHIPGYYVPNDRRVLQEGMVITIEPFLSTRTTMVEQASRRLDTVRPPARARRSMNTRW